MVTKKMRRTAHFSRLEVNATNFYCVFVRKLQTCIWTLKTEDDPFIKKKKNEEKAAYKRGKHM